MSLGNFSAFGVPERQYSDVESVQQPVQDNSKAVEAQGYATGLSSIASFGNTAIQIRDSQREQERLAAKERAKKLDKTYSNRYDSAIRKFTGMYESGEINQQQLKTYLGMTKDELISMGASADNLSETELKVTKTLAGKALAEGTDQDQLEKATWKAFSESKWGRASRTPEEAKINFTKWQAEQAKLVADEAEMQSLQLEAARYEKGTREREQANLAVKDKQTQIINNQLKDMPVNTNTAITELHENFQKESIDPAVGKAQALVNYENGIKKYFLGVRQLVKQADSSVEGGLPAQRQAAIDMIDSYEKFALENVGESKFIEKAKQLQDIKTTKLALTLARNESVQLTLAARELYGENALLQIGKAATDSYTFINNFNAEALIRDEGDAAPRLDLTSEGAKLQFKALQADLDEYLEGTFTGDTEALDKRVSLNLAYLNDNIGKLDGKKADDLLKVFESPSFGEYVKQRKLSNADIRNAKEAMRIHKDKVPDIFKSFLTTMISEENRKATVAKTGPRGRVAAGKINPPTQEDFSVSFEGGQVVLKAVNPDFRELASDWNKKVSAPLTRIIKVDANLSGESQDSVANAWLPALWKTEEEAKEPAKPTIDPSQYEGKAVEDEEGNIFIVRNGAYVKVGGPRNDEQ